MANPKKYYRTTFTFVMLSEDPPGDGWDLEGISYACDQGPNVGFFGEEQDETLTGKQMADALKEAGSEPGFFRLDDDGNQTE